MKKATRSRGKKTEEERTGSKEAGKTRRMQMESSKES